jgi:uncharacterized protein (DUF169 family)
MELVKKFKDQIGGAWTTVKFYQVIPEGENLTHYHDIHFCEAITKAMTSGFILTQPIIDCPGARYAFGWDEKDEDTLIETLSKENEMYPSNVKSLLKHIPRLDGKFKAIGLNIINEQPDVIISYAHPKLVMRLLRNYQRQTGENLEVSFSGLLTVCGNVAVKSFLSQKIAMSFCCSKSRKHGGISRDRLAIGIPYAIIDSLV